MINKFTNSELLELPPGRVNSKMNLKKEINKTLSQDSTVACRSQRKMERPCAWPMLYLEINGNDDDVCCQTCNKEIAYDLILICCQTDIKKYFCRLIAN